MSFFMRYVVSKYFLALQSYSFLFSKQCLSQSKGFNSDEVQLVHCSFIDHLFCDISKNSLPNHRSQRFFPRLSSTSFIVLHFYL